MRSRSIAAGLALALALMPIARPPRAQTGTDSGPAGALLQAAERRDREGDLAGAIADYELIVQQFPDSPQAPEALLRIAQGRLAVGDSAAAAAAVEALVATYPGAPQTAAGLLLEGRMSADHPRSVEDLLSARKSLEKVWLLFPRVDYPALPARSAARVLDGQIALRLDLAEEGSTSFVEVVEMEPESSWNADAHIGFGTALVRSGEWQAAAESFQEALGVAGASAESRALARSRLALLHRRFIRPAIGTRLWEGARAVAVTGVETRRLSGAAAGPAGRLLLVDSGADLAILLAADGTVDKRWAAPDGYKPSWDRAGNYHVATDDSIQLPENATKQFRDPAKDRALDGIRSVERGPFGEWIVLGSRSTGVLTYPAESGPARALVGSGGDPVDLALDSTDRLYVLEKKGRRVVSLDLKSGEAARTAVNGAWRQAAAVAVDPFGFVHVLDGGSRSIHSYGPSGEEIGAVGPVLPGGVELRKPEDLAAGADGRLFVADERAGLIVLE